ncbi:MAG: cytochrome c oxidase subunit 2 [Deltaproteobacteria bacterium]|jgi:cytochrome c oxidase subunit 2|nr:cytochrome c oxidase subunit 2 [Deltaproteobacteria bacterium]
MRRVEKAALSGAAVLIAIGSAALVTATSHEGITIPSWMTKLWPAAARPATRGGGTAISGGRRIFEQKGCVACHSTDGTPNVGPTLKGLYGSTVEFEDGSTRTADTTFLEEFIRDPRKRTIKGVRAIMPRTELTDEELRQLIAYLQSLS